MDQKTIIDFKNNKRTRIKVLDNLIKIDKKIYSSVLFEYEEIFKSLKSLRMKGDFNNTIYKTIAIKLSKIELEIIKYRTEFNEKIYDIFLDNCIKYLNKELIIKYIPIKEKNEVLNGLLSPSMINVFSDDWKIINKSNNYINFSSEEEIKMAILVFVISYIEVIKKEYNQNFPLFLDDVFRELDIDNINLLLKVMEDKSINCLITTQELKKIRNQEKIKIINL